MSVESLRSVAELDGALLSARRAGATVGFVATLGALHRGHESLIGFARRHNDVVVASVFLNPLQFNDQADLERYPSDEASDLALAERAGADVVFAPSVDTMYPRGEPVVSVDPGSLGAVLEGASRPGHFRGVATVVAKMFTIVRPTRAYFGEKDYQQLVVVRKLVDDLSFAIDVVGCPTVRDDDGLAVSSRNVLLGLDERRAASVLYRALRVGAEAAAAGRNRIRDVEEAVRSVAATEQKVELDYVVAVRESTLEQLDVVAGDARLLIAGRVGKVRLIDNLRVGR